MIQTHQKHHHFFILAFAILLSLFIPALHNHQTQSAYAAGTQLSFTVFLHGIGKGGDNANAAGGGNSNPVTKQRIFSVGIFNAQNVMVTSNTFNGIYNSTTGAFTGTIDLGNLPGGVYTITVRSDKYLQKAATGIQTITAGTVNQIAPIFLPTGDIDNNNQVNIVDFNLLMGCYSDLAAAKSCTAAQKTAADLTDDGSVNQLDYNLFIREMGNRSGEGNPTTAPVQPTVPNPTTAPPTGCTNCTAPPFAANAGKKWQVSFSEEFNGSDYDHAKLTPCFDWNTGDCTSTFNNGREHYLPAQVQVSNGTAKLIAAPLSPAYANSACQNGKCTYKAGLLSIARTNANNGTNYLYKFTYGYVEARIKVAATRGFFTAFWMLPADPSYNYRSEIDILEMLGDDPTTWFMTYHYAGRDQSYTPNKGKLNNGACAVKDYSKDFVRMGMDWEANRIAWYIDGVKCGEFTDASQIENGPMQIILHMMVDNTWQRDWNVGLQDPTLTRQLEVDYLRVYQQVPQ